MRRSPKPASRPRLSALLAVALLLCGCGQSGPLYLPDSRPTPAASAAPAVAPTPGSDPIAEPAAEPRSTPMTPAATAAPQTPPG